jgi:transcriptional regulator with PAS, ATPase and Fis domain
VLQEGAFERVGDEKSIRVNVRVVSATNKNIQKEIKEGRFRSDLFYRMCVVPVIIPPLRDRRGDIPYLIDHILKKALKEYKRNELEVSPEAFAALVDYDWPGNVRELQNAIQYALVKCGGNLIQVNHLPSTISERHSPRKGPEEKLRKRKLNAETVDRALKEAKGNKIKAARKLGVSRATLYRFLGMINKGRNF